MKGGEIRAKSLLIRNKSPESWFGVSWNMNLYRGCEHGCIYCDSRSQCYGIENFASVQVKINAPHLLAKELSRKRRVAVVGTGAMSDPYTPAERNYKMTRRALEIIDNHGFPVHIATKSDLVVRDIDLLKSINRKFASVAFTLTTADDSLASVIEPGAPPPSARLAAMKELSGAGIYTGVLLMPVLPFIEDTPENIVSIFEKAHRSGAGFVMPFFGMTLRDRQREYFYSRLDRHFPGLRRRYEQSFGDSYRCMSGKRAQLYRLLRDRCRAVGMACDMRDVKRYQPDNDCVQPRLFV
jgi:DNA repair photolyase